MRCLGNELGDEMIWRLFDISIFLGSGWGPRDDLESLGYVIVFLMHGSLPWYSPEAATQDSETAETWNMILEKKESVEIDVLCK